MELADRFDNSEPERNWDDEPTSSRGETLPPNAECLIELQRLLATFTEDEIHAFHFLAQKHAVGRAKYGPLDFATETREFRFEGASELADFLNYSSFWHMMQVLAAKRRAA